MTFCSRSTKTMRRQSRRSKRPRNWVRSPRRNCPPAIDLKELAEREGLSYEVTPSALPRASRPIRPDRSDAEVGISQARAEAVSSPTNSSIPRKPLYEPEELTDLLGTRFLARKIKDVPPHVPSLDWVRSDVSLAWKMAKARALAENAAQAAGRAAQEKGEASSRKAPSRVTAS